MHFLKIAGVYVGVFALFSVLYLGSFHTPLLGSEEVLFYRGVLLLALVFILFAAVIVFLYWGGYIVRLESAAAALVASAAIHLAIFIVFPVTFDRSVTMYLLYALERSPQAQSCSGYSPTELEQTFLREYVGEQAALARRVEEQEIINMVDVSGQCIALTKRGEKFLQFSRAFGALYGVTLEK
jgi:hypothetical protein